MIRYVSLASEKSTMCSLELVFTSSFKNLTSDLSKTTAFNHLTYRQCSANILHRAILVGGDTEMAITTRLHEQTHRVEHRESMLMHSIRLRFVTTHLWTTQGHDCVTRCT